MSAAFAGLAPAQLEAVADTLRRTGVADAAAVAAFDGVSPDRRSQLASEIGQWVGLAGIQGAAAVLDVIANERRSTLAAADRRIELVWTGPERDHAGTRDTAVVVRELFSQANRDVLVSTYGVFGGQEIFESLAERMSAKPALRVRMCLNVSRSEGDARDVDMIAAEFARLFAEREWPRRRLPELYFDERALERDARTRAVLHAKCIVVDDERAFVTSANFTEAAQSRNIEAGVLLNDPQIALALRLQFDDLINRGELRRA